MCGITGSIYIVRVLIVWCRERGYMVDAHREMRLQGRRFVNVFNGMIFFDQKLKHESFNGIRVLKRIMISCNEKFEVFLG